MHQFTTFLMLPHHHERTIPGWQGESANVFFCHDEFVRLCAFFARVQEDFCDVLSHDNILYPSGV